MKTSAEAAIVTAEVAEIIAKKRYYTGQPCVINDGTTWVWAHPVFDRVISITGEQGLVCLCADDGIAIAVARILNLQDRGTYNESAGTYRKASAQMDGD